MQAAQYPEKKCREAVYNSAGLAYSCELVDLHPGPCASFSVTTSVEARDRFEESTPDWRTQVGQMDDLA